MSDLEKFLQQAAQRMKERQQAAGQPARPKQAQSTRNVGQQSPPRGARPPVRQAERQAVPVDDIDEVVEAQVVQRRAMGPDRLSEIDTRPAPVTDGVNQADERMADHLQEAFEHTVGQLAAAQKPKTTQTDKPIEVQSSQNTEHWLTDILKNPDSLRSAFIASEIFKTKF